MTTVLVLIVVAPLFHGPSTTCRPSPSSTCHASTPTTDPAFGAVTTERHTYVQHTCIRGTTAPR